MMEKINSKLQDFSPIKLNEMDGVKLMSRVDTKYILPFNQLSDILDELTEFYKVLEIKDTRLLCYRTTYFDTENFAMYNAHQNGKMNRYKIRKREYIIDSQGFLEIKFKNNKGKTVKTRIPNQFNDTKFNKHESEFIKDKTLFDANDLKPALMNKFSRITLVHKTDKERITLDCDLNFENASGNKIGLPSVSIAEIKREKISIHSDFIRLMRKRGVRPFRVSKYCIGSVLLNKNLKYNRFKHKLLKIKKI